MKICIDCYGNQPDKNPGMFLSPDGIKPACLVDSKVDGVTYMCFRNVPDPQPIHRVLVDNGVTQILWAYGPWSNRDKLSYETDLCTPLIVDPLSFTPTPPPPIPEGVLATIQQMGQPGEIFSDVTADWSLGLTMSMYWDTDGDIDESTDFYYTNAQLYGLGLELAGGAIGMCVGFYKDNGNNEINFQALNDQAGSSGAGDWDQSHSLIFTVDRTAELIHFYIDGVEIYTTNADDIIPAFGEGIGQFFAGGAPAKNIRIWNRPLTAEECAAVAEADLA